MSTEITPRELFERVVTRGEALPILDVRNEDEFAAWKIEGRRPLTYLNLPYFASAEEKRPPLVLVAARDLGTRRDVRRVAEVLGYGTHEVADGVEAFEAALRLKPSVVIMDRVLPRLGADELAVRLKAHTTTSDVPLLALASRAEMGERAELFEAFVPQPLDGEQLAGLLGGLPPATG